MSAPNEHAGLERAGFVTRATALVIDAVIVAVMIRGGAWLVDGLDRALGRFAPPVDLGRLVFACTPLVIAGYLLGFWTALGQTPGKLLMGLKVVPLGGGRLTFRRAVVRLVGYVLSALPFYLGFVWVLGPQRRGWHDRLARTEVTYVRRRPQETNAVTELRRRIHPMR